MEMEGKKLVALSFTDLIHNIKKEETNCDNIHLNTSMAIPEPQVSSMLEETQIVSEIDPLESPSWPRCVRVMDTTEASAAKIPRMETEASSFENSDVTTAIKQETEASGLENSDVTIAIKQETEASSLENGDVTIAIKQETEASGLENSDVTIAIKQETEASSLENGDVTIAIKQETEASSLENGDVTIAIKQELCVAEGPYEIQLETNQDSSETENAFEDIRFHWNMREIQTRLETREQCIKFAEDRGLIPTKKMCSHHRRPMSFRSSHQHLGTFRCNKANCRRSKYSRAAGTWFSNANVPIWMVFQLMYMYCHQYTYLAAQKASARDDGKMLSSVTIANWYTYCRETVIVYHLEHQEADYKIGGPGKIVHIRQVKIGERQFKSGSHIEGQWVLVMMEAGNDELRLEVCPDNEESAKMLLPMIVEKHIKVGSAIHTSSWVAYHCLSDHGFVHKTGDHSTENGVEEVKGTNAEDTDSNWVKLKKLFKRHNYKNYTDWLVEYSWRQKIKKSHKCPFEELLKAVKYVY